MNTNYITTALILLSIECSANTDCVSNSGSNGEPMVSQPINKPERSEDYRACIGQSTSAIDVAACQDQELKREDKALNKAYKTAINDIQNSRRSDLKQMQRLWIKYRDARCTFFYHKESGSGGLNDQMDCFIDMTKQRTEELKNLVTQ